MSTNIIDRLIEKIDEKQNPCVVGLDPVLNRIPVPIMDHAKETGTYTDALRIFNEGIVDAVADLVPAVKLQIAFYEMHGKNGLEVFKKTVDYARSKGLIVMEDGKRNDIESTARAYADGHLGVVDTWFGPRASLDVDFLTVNPYLGSDGLKPFVEVCQKQGKGIFILAKTSNPSSGELQDRLVELRAEERSELERIGIETRDERTVRQLAPLYHIVALQVNRFARISRGKRNYSPIGAVVGATYPEQAEVLRKIMPNSFFLVPGYGTQGGGARDIPACFNSDGYGAVVNNSRGIIYAYEKTGKPAQFAEAAREATQVMIAEVRSALKQAGKWPERWK